MNRTEKEALVEKMHGQFSKGVALVAADFKGMPVEDVNELRKSMRENEIDYFVAKNTLTRLAVKETKFSGIAEALTGVNAIGISYDDPVKLAKMMQKFTEGEKGLTVKFGYLARGEQLLDAKQVDTLSKVPSREELLSKLAFLMSSPYARFATVLNEVMGKFVRTLEAVRADKEAKGA